MAHTYRVAIHKKHEWGILIMTKDQALKLSEEIQYREVELG